MLPRKCGKKTEELEADLVDVRKEDKTIRPFLIPSQPEIVGNVLKISSYSTIKKHRPTAHKSNIILKKIIIC